MSVIKTGKKSNQLLISIFTAIKMLGYVIICLFGSLELCLWLGMPAWAWQLMIFALIMIPIQVEELLHRHIKRGEKQFQRGEYKKAYQEFTNFYDYILKYPWVDRFRNWLPFFYSQDSMKVGMLFNMAVCSFYDGDVEKGLGLIDKIKTEWPDSEVASGDYSFLEPDSYEQIQRESEIALIEGLRPLLLEGEVLDIQFYGVVTRRGKREKRCKRSLCFIGMAGDYLLLTVLKKNKVDTIRWRERFLLYPGMVTVKKTRCPVHKTLQFVLPDREKLTIEFSHKLCIDEYPGQEENTNRFLKRILRQ